MRGWWIVAAGIVGVYGVLAVLVRIAPGNVVDRALFGWVSGWDVPLLDGAVDWVSWFTDIWPRLLVGFVGALGIALVGRHRLVAATAFAAAIMVIPVNGLDLIGGIVAGRIRPNGAPFLAYPSGPTIVQYGLGIYFMFLLGLHRRLLLPLVTLMALPVVLAGPARISTGAHWLADVLGGYLLGAASVIALVLRLEIAERRLTGRGLLRDSLRPAFAPPPVSPR